MADLQLLLEAERRGLLPADKQALLTEARSRGLVEGLPTETPPIKMTLAPTEVVPERSMAQRITYPILETVLPTLGAVAGGVPSTIFGPAGTVAGGAAGAGLGYGAAKEIEKIWEEKNKQRAPVTPTEGLSDAAKNILTGATFEVGGRVILPPVAKAAGWLWDATTGKLVQIKAGKIIQELAGPNLSAVKEATANAPKDLTGAQAISGVEASPLQTLAARAAEHKPYVYRPLEQAQEAGRVARLNAVTPDKALAVTERAAASEPLYKEAASAIIPIDPEMKAIFARLPEGTINAAKELAKREGRPFIFGESVPGVESATKVGGTPQITGESLHYIKRALSDIANSQATKNVGKDAQRATQGVLSDFLNTVETKLPAYGQARQAFKVGSEPVNQAEVLNQMRTILGTPEGRESAKPFLNSLGKGEQALLKKATGYARYEEGDLAKVLTPTQMDTVNNIANELVRNAKIAEQAKAGHTMYEDVLKANTWGLPRINILNRAATVANETMDLLERRLTKKVSASLFEGMRSGASLDKLLNTVPTSQRNEVYKILLSDPKFGATITSQGVNALSSNQQNQNALANQ